MDYKNINLSEVNKEEIKANYKLLRSIKIGDVCQDIAGNPDLLDVILDNTTEEDFEETRYLIGCWGDADEVSDKVQNNLKINYIAVRQVAIANESKNKPTVFYADDAANKYEW